MKRVSLTHALPVLIIVSLVASALIVTSSHILKPITDTLFSQNLIYSKSAVLIELWADDHVRLIQSNSNRVIDIDKTPTSSDAQSRMMLRSVWIDDKQTFDKLSVWSQANLLKSNGTLASTYDNNGSGNYLVTNSASQSGADIDSALSYLMAYRRWGDEKYLEQAKVLINGIYTNEVKIVNGTAYLLPSDASSATDGTTINPADYKLYAFREFAKVDASHPWNDLVSTGLTTMASVLKKTGGSLSIQDVRISALGEIAITPATSSLSSEMAAYAFNLSLDYSWNKTESTMEQLGSMTAIEEQYAQTGKVYVDGKESLSGYGQVIGYFKYMQPKQAETVAITKLFSYYSQDSQSARNKTETEYESSVGWFGMALDNDQLTQLTENK